MAAGTYAYTGWGALGYPDYRDAATSRMLIAEPGQSYGIAAVDGQAPVPPSDGRWQASPPPPPPPPPVLAVPAAASPAAPAEAGAR